MLSKVRLWMTPVKLASLFQSTYWHFQHFTLDVDEISEGWVGGWNLELNLVPPSLPECDCGEA